LIYLFLRTIIAQFLAANIHDSSKYPIEVIKSIPLEGWCVEMQRISDEARSQTIALSGMKFFYLTRKSILGVSFLNGYQFYMFSENFYKF